MTCACLASTASQTPIPHSDTSDDKQQSRTRWVADLFARRRHRHAAADTDKACSRTANETEGSTDCFKLHAKLNVNETKTSFWRRKRSFSPKLSHASTAATEKSCSSTEG